MTELGLRTIPGYLVHELLETDLVSTTYLAERESDGFPVMLQIISDDIVDGGANLSFRSGIERAAHIKHPVLPTIWDVGRASDLLYCATAPVEGRSLAATLAARGRLSRADVTDIVMELADALDTLHAFGVVHGAVNPLTVWINNRERVPGAPPVSLRGVGSSALLARVAEREAQGAAPPDLLWTAPEQVRYGDLGPKVDQYALACLTAHALTGRPPFDRPTLSAVAGAHLTADPSGTETGLAPLLPHVRDAIVRGMSKDPDERFATCQAFALAITDDGSDLEIDLTEPVPQAAPVYVDDPGAPADAASATAGATAASAGADSASAGADSASAGADSASAGADSASATAASTATAAGNYDTDRIDPLIPVAFDEHAVTHEDDSSAQQRRGVVGMIDPTGDTATWPPPVDTRASGSDGTAEIRRTITGQPDDPDEATDADDTGDTAVESVAAVGDAPTSGDRSTPDAAAAEDSKQSDDRRSDDAVETSARNGRAGTSDDGRERLTARALTALDWLPGNPAGDAEPPNASPADRGSSGAASGASLAGRGAAGGARRRAPVADHTAAGSAAANPMLTRTAAPTGGTTAPPLTRRLLPWLAGAVAVLLIAATVAAVLLRTRAPTAPTDAGAAAPLADAPQDDGAPQEPDDGDPAAAADEVAVVGARWSTAATSGTVDRLVRTGDVVVAGSDDEIAVLDADSGETRWTTAVDGDLDQVLAIDDVLVVGADGDVTGYEVANGQRLWSLDADGDPPSYTAVAGARGRLFGVWPTDDGTGFTVAAIDPATGRTSWTLDGSGSTPNSDEGTVGTSDDTSAAAQMAVAYDPTTRGERTLYVLQGSALHAIDTTARQVRWRTEVSRPAAASLTAISGSAVLLRGRGEVCRYGASDGALVWTACPVLERSEDGDSVVRAGSGRVLVANDDEVAAIDYTSGTLDWRLTRTDDFGRAVAAAGGTAWTPRGDAVVAVEQSSGDALWRSEPLGAIAALTASSEAVYAATDDGRVVALPTSASG